MIRKLLLLCMLILSAQQNHAQNKIIDELKLKVTAIQDGERKVAENEWQDLSIQAGNTLYVGFENQPSTKDPIFHKVFLDGILLEPRLIDNYYSIKNPEIGTHLLKLIAFSAKGKESLPVLLKFSVVVPVKKNSQNEQSSSVSEENSSGGINNSILVIILGCLSGIFLLVILFLLIKRKPKKVDKSKRIEEELKEMKLAYNRVKDELNKQADENTNLKVQIKELDANVKSLENTNVHLVEQKEKLIETKNKLEMLHTQKEELFASVIHDIKNPASAIRGYIELLNSYELNANEQQEIMQSLVESSEDIMKLSQDMCTIIAKALPEPKLKFKKASLKTIIDAVFSQNSSYAKVKQVKIFNKSPDILPEVNMDAEKIEEALDNLVNNAIKYAPPETKVEIITFINDLNKKTIVVQVKDNGVGLSEEDLKKSFQKGSILSAKPTGLEQSSGLGLWIVKRIIEEHGGKVSVESKEGVGSTFSFELPLE